MMDRTALRQQAEEKARAIGDQDLEALSPEEMRQLVHELRVHQIELEMQNEELRRSHEELELLLDIVPGWITYLGPDLQIVRANGALAEWWGYSKAQAVGKNYKEVARPEAYEWNLPHLRQALASRQKVTHEIYAVSAAGQTAIGQVSSIPHLDEQGNVLGLAVMVVDITAQKHAEEELLAQQQKLDLILDSLPGYIVYFDRDMNVLHANRALAEWLGYSKDEIVGKPSTEIARPGSYEYNMPYFQQTLESRQTVTYELQSVSVKGQFAFARTTSVPHLDEEGNVQGIVVYLQDVTAQKQAEQALRASEEKYRLLIENMHEGIVVIDDHGILTYVNDAMCEMSGYTPDELLGQPSTKFYSPEQYGKHLDRLERRRAGLSDKYESVLTSKDGAQISTIISASSILDPQGNFRGALAVLTDISERVKTEEKLQRSVEELTLLNQIAHTMAIAAELPATLTRASEIIADLFAAQCVHIIWPEDEKTGNHLHFQCESTSGQASHTLFDISMEDLTAAGLMKGQVKAQIVADVQSLPLLNQQQMHPSVQSAMFIPLAIGGKVVGWLLIGKEHLRHSFTENMIGLAETIAVDLAAAIDRTQLNRKAQEAAVIEERNRLARELHDSITQTLYSVSIQAEALPRVLERDLEEGKRNARLMRQIVLEAVVEMRTLLIELRPGALETTDLNVLLRQLADSLRSRSRVNLDLKFDGKVELPPDVKICFYRITQEAFNNIARHAYATNVTGVLQDLPDRVLLTFQDDGRGFNPNSVPAGRMGMQIMHERATRCGLQLRIESQVGRGTTIAVSWQKVARQRTGNR